MPFENDSFFYNPYIFRDFMTSELRVKILIPGGPGGHDCTPEGLVYHLVQVTGNKQTKCLQQSITSQEISVTSYIDIQCK